MNNKVDVKEIEKFVDENAKDVEPAVRKAIGAAATFAVVTIAAAVGMEINDINAQWIYVLISFLAPIGTGWMIRKGVLSPNTAKLLFDYYREGRIPGNGNDPV